MEKNPETEFKTCVSIFEEQANYSNPLYGRVQVDVTKALHGIAKTFAYAPRYNARVEIDGSKHECIDGMTGSVNVQLVTVLG